MRTEYISDDGRRFSTKEECEAYEQNTLAGIKNLANKIIGFCQGDRETKYTFESFMKEEYDGSDLSILDYIDYIYENCNALLITEDFTIEERSMIPSYCDFNCYVQGEYHYFEDENRFINKEKILQKFIKSYCSEWNITIAEVKALLDTF